MASSGLPIVSLPELLAIPDDRDAISLTFDDAYVNFETEAWPRLRAYGLPAMLFVPTAFVGRSNDWTALPGGAMPRLPILDWKALARLQESGLTLGAHTRRHPDLRRLDGAALEDEIDGSFEDIGRETGRRPDAFAYPYGFTTGGAVARVRAAGALAVTTELRPLGAGDDAHLLPRLDSFYLEGPGRIEGFGTPAFRHYFRLRLTLRTLAQRLRRAGGR